MQFAIVNGIRSKPLKGMKGFCPGCEAIMIAKCGNVKVHHWARKCSKLCDPWWEPETEWHRKWKEQFSEEFRELMFKIPQVVNFMKHLEQPSNYFLFEWTYKHFTWQNNTSPTFFDSGGENLYYLIQRLQTSIDIFYFNIVKKSNFIEKYK